MSSHFATSQRGSTLIELGIAGAILGLTLVAGYQAVGGVGVAVRDGMDRSEVVPNGGFLLTQLAKAVRHADPDS
ncbi:MAG: PulJ/GspJ family protein, partial [Planctomycetota bacterium]